MITAKLRPLKDVADVIRGVTFSRNEGKATREKNTVPVIRAGNIQKQLLLDEGLIYVPQEKVSDRQHLMRGDIVVCTSSGSADIVGKTAYCERDWEGGFGAFCATIRSDVSICDSRFLFYFLRSPHFLRWTKKSSGANIKNIRKSELDDFPVPVPDVSEQRRIAAILDKADAILRKREHALSLADDFLRSAFLEMFGDPVTNPKGWPEKPLEDISSIHSGLTKGRNLSGRKVVNLPYMRVANVQDGHIKITDIKTIELAESEVEKFLLQTGDILLTEGGDPDKLGRGAVWQGEIERCVHQNHIFRVHCESAVANPYFVSAQIGSARGKRYFLRSAKQTTGIATINKTQLRGFPVLLPPIERQKEYADIRTRTEQWRNNLNAAIVLSDQTFAALSQRAFKGDL